MTFRKIIARSLNGYSDRLLEGEVEDQPHVKGLDFQIEIGVFPSAALHIELCRQVFTDGILNTRACENPGPLQVNAGRIDLVRSNPCGDEGTDLG